MPQLQNDETEDLSRQVAPLRVTLQHSFDLARLEVTPTDRGLVEQEIAHPSQRFLRKPALIRNRKPGLLSPPGLVRDLLSQCRLQDVPCLEASNLARNRQPCGKFEDAMIQQRDA